MRSDKFHGQALKYQVTHSQRATRAIVRRLYTQCVKRNWHPNLTSKNNDNLQRSRTMNILLWNFRYMVDQKSNKTVFCLSWKLATTEPWTCHRNKRLTATQQIENELYEKLTKGNTSGGCNRTCLQHLYSSLLNIFYLPLFINWRRCFFLAHF